MQFHQPKQITGMWPFAEIHTRYCSLGVALYFSWQSNLQDIRRPAGGWGGGAYLFFSHITSRYIIYIWSERNARKLFIVQSATTVLL